MHDNIRRHAPELVERLDVLHNESNGVCSISRFRAIIAEHREMIRALLAAAPPEQEQSEPQDGDACTRAYERGYQHGKAAALGAGAKDQSAAGRTLGQGRQAPARPADPSPVMDDGLPAADPSALIARIEPQVKGVTGRSPIVFRLLLEAREALAEQGEWLDRWGEACIENGRIRERIAALERELVEAKNLLRECLDSQALILPDEERKEIWKRVRVMLGLAAEVKLLAVGEGDAASGEPHEQR